jgi:hypothetical protein
MVWGCKDKGLEIIAPRAEGRRKKTKAIKKGRMDY